MRLQIVVFVVFLWPSLTRAQQDFIHAPTMMTWDNAVNYCREHNRYLVRIDNVEENNHVVNYARVNRIETYWVDVNDKSKENYWVDSDNVAVGFQPWLTGYPNGGCEKNCGYGSISVNGQWCDWFCHGVSTVICEMQCDHRAQQDFIHATTTMTFDDAVNYCRDQNRNLVRIDNVEENNRVVNYARVNRIETYWVDVNDKSKENYWVDSDNVAVGYQPWYIGYPNGACEKNCGYGSISVNGQWCDWFCHGTSTVICEIQHDHRAQQDLIHAPTTMTFDNAVNYCNEQNRNLVRIDNVEENDRVVNYARVNKIETYWVDANDKSREHYWVDSDNVALGYQPWYIGYPNGGFEKNCGYGSISVHGKWCDWYCHGTSSVICEERKH